MRTDITSLTILVCLTHSPETHPYIARKDVVKKMLEICKQKHKTTNVQSQQAQEDPMMTNALKYVRILHLIRSLICLFPSHA